jgi:hypothetical protein
VGNNINLRKYLGRKIFGIAPAIISAYDSDFQLVIDAIQSTGVTLTTTEKNAGNQLVIDCKSNGVWAKLLSLYGILGGTAGAHKWNWKNPIDTNGAFRINFSSGWTHSANGMQPTNAYAQTFIVPGTNYPNIYDIAFGIYSRTNSVGNFVDIGVKNGLATGNPSGELWLSGPGNLAVAYNLRQTNTTTTRILVSNPNSLGLHTLCSNGTNTQILYKNGSVLGSNTSNGTQVNTYGFFIGALNNTGSIQLYSNRQYSFSFFSNGLTATENADLYTAVQTYQTALGRQV